MISIHIINCIRDFLYSFFFIPIKMGLITTIIMQNRVRSELQLQVLRFTREAWKFIYSRPEPLRTNLSTHLRSELELHKDIPRNRFHKIEYQLRKGRNRLTMLRNTSIDNVSLHWYSTLIMKNIADIISSFRPLTQCQRITTAFR